ncbi:MAG: metalloregulator ArsR/SmtB family transcription factor [Rubripirellula sp.]
MNDPFAPPSCDSKDDAPLSEEQFHRIAKAIADPQRFAILSCIAATPEIPCKMLVAEFSVTQATISHHLKELVAAKLIRSRRDGQMAILSCRRDVCDAYAQYLSLRLVTPADRPQP